MNELSNSWLSSLHNDLESLNHDFLKWHQFQILSFLLLAQSNLKQLSHSIKIYKTINQKDAFDVAFKYFEWLSNYYWLIYSLYKLDSSSFDVESLYSSELYNSFMFTCQILSEIMVIFRMYSSILLNGFARKLNQKFTDSFANNYTKKLAKYSFLFNFNCLVISNVTLDKDIYNLLCSNLLEKSIISLKNSDENRLIYKDVFISTNEFLNLYLDHYLNDYEFLENYRLILLRCIKEDLLSLNQFKLAYKVTVHSMYKIEVFQSVLWRCFQDLITSIDKILDANHNNQINDSLQFIEVYVDLIEFIPSKYWDLYWQNLTVFTNIFSGFGSHYLIFDLVKLTLNTKAFHSNLKIHVVKWLFDKKKSLETPIKNNTSLLRSSI